MFRVKCKLTDGDIRWNPLKNHSGIFSDLSNASVNFIFILFLFVSAFCIFSNRINNSHSFFLLTLETCSFYSQFSSILRLSLFRYSLCFLFFFYYFSSFLLFACIYFFSFTFSSFFLSCYFRFFFVILPRFLYYCQFVLNFFLSFSLFRCSLILLLSPPLFSLFVFFFFRFLFFVFFHSIFHSLFLLFFLCSSLL